MSECLGPHCPCEDECRSARPPARPSVRLTVCLPSDEPCLSGGAEPGCGLVRQLLSGVRPAAGESVIARDRFIAELDARIIATRTQMQQVSLPAPLPASSDTTMRRAPTIPLSPPSSALTPSPYPLPAPSPPPPPPRPCPLPSPFSTPPRPQHTPLGVVRVPSQQILFAV